MLVSLIEENRNLKQQLNEPNKTIVSYGVEDGAQVCYVRRQLGDDFEEIRTYDVRPYETVHGVLCSSTENVPVMHSKAISDHTKTDGMDKT